MTDFRDRLYERYVSAFKGLAPPPDETADEHRRAWARSKLLPHFEHVDRTAPVLELGCGAGDFLDLLRAEGFAALEGIDLADEQIAIAARRGLPARRGDARSFLSAAHEQYAAIVALDFFEHFTRDELLDLFPLIRQALRPDGTLVLQTPNGEGLFPNQVIYGDLTHMTIFNSGSLQQLLTLSGFDRIEFFETGPTPTHFMARLRAMAWSAIRGAASLVRRIETGKVQRIWTENLICRCRRAERGGETG